MDLLFRVIVVAVLYIVSETITNIISSQYNPFEDLVVFLNGCLKKKVDIISINENTLSSSENKLKKGDEIHILTNDLMNYDLHKPALLLTAKNIIKGAKYYYYIPDTIKEDYISFKLRLIEEIQRQIQTDSKKAEDIFNNKVFFLYIPDENHLSYNFSLTLFSDPRNNTGCWYISENDITLSTGAEDTADLLMVRMNSFDDVKALRAIIIKLIKRYNLNVAKNSRLRDK